jgi:hypothetical protein
MAHEIMQLMVAIGRAWLWLVCATIHYAVESRLNAMHHSPRLNAERIQKC